MPVTKAKSSILRKNSTGSDFERRRVNLVEGSNVTLTVSDDSTNNEIDVTIASTGGSGTPGGSDTHVQFNDSSAFGGEAAFTYDKTNNLLSADTYKTGTLVMSGLGHAFAQPIVLGGATPYMFIYHDTTYNIMRIGAQNTASAITKIAFELPFNNNYQDVMALSGTSLAPSSTFNNLIDLGSSGVEWKSLFIGAGGVSTFRNSIIVNENGLDADTRIEGDTDANLFFVDASTDRVGIGTNTPAALLDVDGTARVTTLNIGGTDVTSTAAELNILDGVTATASELNVLDGITSTVTELNYTDGVTSAIQTQLDAKQAEIYYTVGAANADYITDGTADEVQIQQAVDAAEAAGGGVVFILEGTYNIVTDVVVDSDNVIIKGVGSGTILKATAGQDPNIIKLTGVSNCEVSHIKIDGNRANVSPQGTPQYAVESGIFVTGCDNISINNCEIVDCYSSGILVDSTDNIRIEHNKLSGSLDNQIFLRPTDVVGMTPGVGVTNATIVGNNCSDSDFSGIVAIKSDYISVVNNVIYTTGITDGQGCGIGFEGCRWSNMVGNVVHGGGVQGLNVRHTLEGTVGATELLSSDITLSGNVITGTASTNGDAGGISVTDSEYVMVTGNHVSACAKGINITTAGTTGCADIYLNANIVEGSTANGIILANTQADSPVILTNNYIKGTAGHGLFSTVLTYIMDGNVFTGSTGGGSNGIRFDTGASGIVQGSVFTDNADNGILLDGTSGPFDIRNNVSYDAGATTQGRFFYEGASAGPSRLIGNRSTGMVNEDFHQSHGSSVAYLNDFDDASDADMTDQAKLAALTATATELNYVDGVTSAIQTQLDGKVNDTGSETIAGVKTFSSDPIIPDEAYDATAWNGSLEPPTKNAVRDKIESMGSGGLGNVVEDTTPQLGGNLDLNSFTVGAATAADLTKLNALTATSTELNYVDGVTSAIQTQLDAMVEKAGDTMTGNLTIDNASKSSLTLLGNGDGTAYSEIGLRSDEATDHTWYLSHKVSGNAFQFIYTPDDIAFFVPLTITDDTVVVDGDISADNLSGTNTGDQDLADLGVTASSAELNILDGATLSTAELNILDGVTATASELNALDGITATVTELNYTDGVTSAIQTQIDTKAPLASPTFTGTVTLPVGLTGVIRADTGVVSVDTDVTDLVSASSAILAGKVELATDAETTTGTDTTRAITPANLTSQIGSRLQAYDADLATIAGLTATTNNFLISVSSAWASRTPTQALATLGLDSDLPTFSVPASTTISAYGATLVDDADAGTARTTLGVVAGGAGDIWVEKAGDTMTGVLTLAENASIALDPAGSADGKYTGITIAGTAGATLAFGDLIYLDPTDSRWELADANAASGADGDARGILGICVLAAASDGSATTILLNGVVRADTAFPALTVNAPVYVSETAGDIVVTKPTTTDVVIRSLGFALTADEIYFNPSSDYITYI